MRTAPLQKWRGQREHEVEMSDTMRKKNNGRMLPSGARAGIQLNGMAFVDSARTRKVP
jgi:hypothetical protein